MNVAEQFLFSLGAGVLAYLFIGDSGRNQEVEPEFIDRYDNKPISCFDICPLAEKMFKQMEDDFLMSNPATQVLKDIYNGFLCFEKGLMNGGECKVLAKNIINNSWDLSVREGRASDKQIVEYLFDTKWGPASESALKVIMSSGNLTNEKRVEYIRMNNEIISIHREKILSFC